MWVLTVIKKGFVKCEDGELRYADSKLEFKFRDLFRAAEMIDDIHQFAEGIINYELVYEELDENFEEEEDIIVPDRTAFYTEDDECTDYYL